MPSKKFWIVTGLLVAGAGATAVAAQGYMKRGYVHEVHDRGGYHHGMDEFRGKRRGWWRRGPVTKEDFDARTRTRFARMDANGDGVVDTDEARKLIERRMERRGRRWQRRRQRFAQRMMRRFDTDRDGKVTAAEFEGRVGEMFARFDLDSDGRITDADLPPMMRGREILSGKGWVGRRGHGRRGRRFMHILRDADANGDNTISLEEAQAAAAKRFARWDRNQDGAVDKTDIDALRQEIADYRLRRFMHRFGAKDGKLTRDQFTKFRDERFARLDFNGDNQLSRDEMPMRRGRGWKRGHGWHRGDYHDGWRGRHHRGDIEGDRRGRRHGWRHHRGGGDDDSPRNAEPSEPENQQRRL